VSSDAAVPASTVKEHYKILEDTLVGHCLEPWLDSKKRKAISTGKFYFFDIGVLNFLSGVFPESESSPVYGNRFEHFIVNEVLCANSYLRAKKDLRFWRSTSNFEVDLIFGDTAIEIKSTTRVSPKHLNGLKALMDEKRMKKYVLVSRDKTEAKSNGIHCLHYKDFLRLLWDGKI
jgi:predicted AAA+ superfamily ATPase